MPDFATLDLSTLQRLRSDPRMGPVQLRKIEARIAELSEPSRKTDAKVIQGSETYTPKATSKRRGVMNQTEARYARTILDPLKARGEILRYEFEAITFHLHDVARYTPDFIAWMPDGTLWAHEVKGGRIWQKDKIRYKAHAKARPWIRWSMMQWKSGRWTVLRGRNPLERTDS